MIDPALRELIGRCAEGRSAHVIEVMLRGNQRRPVVEVFVDTEAGVTTGLCADISRDVAHELTHHPLLPAEYHLIVSSPGIERPLKFPWQFKKHIGRTLSVKVRSWEGIEKVDGKLVSLDDNGLTLLQGKPAGDTDLNGGTHVRFDAIEEALVRAPW